MVRTNTLLMPGTATPAIRIKDSSVNLAMSVDGNGRFCELDPFTGAQIAVAESARNVVCAGAQSCCNYELPEFRKSGKAGHHVAIFACSRWHR